MDDTGTKKGINQSIYIRRTLCLARLSSYMDGERGERVLSRAIWLPLESRCFSHLDGPSVLADPPLSRSVLATMLEALVLTGYVLAMKCCDVFIVLRNVCSLLVNKQLARSR